MDLSMAEVMEVLREKEETWREYEDDLYYDAISGEPMIKDLVRAAKGVEMEMFKKHGAYEKRPIKECWEKTGVAPIGVRWFDSNKGDAENPCRLVAKEIKYDNREKICSRPHRRWKPRRSCSRRGPAWRKCAWTSSTS